MIQALIILGGALLARRNVKEGRGDRRGALRLAAVYVVLGTCVRVLQLPADASSWLTILTRNVAIELFGGAVCLVSYLAIEPAVRRRWPSALVAWGRALDGQLRDPMVGRHVLIGAVGGLGFSTIFVLMDLAGPIFGLPPSAPGSSLQELISGWTRTAGLLFTFQGSLVLPVVVFLGVLVCRLVFRRTWLAYLMVCAIPVVFNAGSGWVRVALVLPMVVLMLLLLTRFGLLAFLVAILFSSWSHIPLTTNSSSWIFPGSAWTMAFFAALAIYGFVVSLGGQKVFKNPIEV
jgi:hypothetical protein